MIITRVCITGQLAEFSSPFLGTFFQSSSDELDKLMFPWFSSPFLGTFFQLPEWERKYNENDCFRPLSWGLSFNTITKTVGYYKGKRFSSPFLGTFFQCDVMKRTTTRKSAVFVPFLGDFLSIS